MPLDGEGGQPAPEAVRPNPEPRAIEDAPEPETPDDEPEASDGPDEIDETIDYEDGGKKYKVPKALKGHLLRQSDYSRQMNELGASKKEIEASREAATEWRQSEEAHQRNLGQLHVVEDQLKAFEKVDWTAWLMHANPNERTRAMAAQAQRLELDRKRGELRRTIEDGRQKHETETKRQIAERLQKTREFAEKEIPGWNDERNKQINDLIQDLGLSPRAAKALYENMEPGLLKALDLALDGKTGRAARTAARKAAEQADANSVVPLEIVGKRAGKTPATRRGPPESMDDYVKWRAAGGGSKRA